MELHFMIAIWVFIGSLILFFFDKIDKTLVALWWAIILILTWVLSPIEAAKSIDIETLLLLFWLMLVVWVAMHSWLFSYINMQIAKKSNWSPRMIFVLMILIMTVSSFVLNNASLILLIIPIAIALAKWLSLDTKLLVILLAIFSNIGWTLTLIWDAPNTLIWVQAKIPFMDFIYNLWIPILIMTIAIFAYIFVVYKDSLQDIKNSLSKVFISKMIIERITYKYINQKMDKYIASVAIIIVILTVLALIFQPQLSTLSWYEHWMIAFIWLAAWILWSVLVMHKVNFMYVMKEVEWDSLLFFAALFIQVRALEKVGLLGMITEQIVQFQDNLPLLLVVIVWWIGMASTVINNIPFVAMMIPVIVELQAKMVLIPGINPADVDLLWWALALGACLGWNATIIGSASWVIAVELAKKRWINISFLEFFKVWMPITIISLIVSTAYLLGVYYLN